MKKDYTEITEDASDKFSSIETPVNVNNEVNLHETSVNISRTDDGNGNNNNKIIMVYGNDIRIKSPCKMGGVFTFLFYNEEPLFVISKQGIININLTNSLYVSNTFNHYQCCSNTSGQICLSIFTYIFSCNRIYHVFCSDL